MKYMPNVEELSKARSDMMIDSRLLQYLDGLTTQMVLGAVFEDDPVTREKAVLKAAGARELFTILKTVYNERN